MLCTNSKYSAPQEASLDACLQGNEKLSETVFSGPGCGNTTGKHSKDICCILSALNVNFIAHIRGR